MYASTALSTLYVLLSGDSSHLIVSVVFNLPEVHPFFIISSFAIVLSLSLYIYIFLIRDWNEQIFGDPDAADIVFTCGADVVAVGINVTHQVVMTGICQKILCHLLFI